MLETISCDHLIRRCATAIGYTMGVPTDSTLSERLADTINDAIAKVYAKARWPQLSLWEKRQYRPPWGPQGWAEGQECFHNGDYWAATKNDPRGEPGTEGADWKLLASDEVVKFIALDQPWEPHEISLSGVDLAAFAFAKDPRIFPNAEPLKGCAWMGDYPGGGTTRVRMPPNAPKEVVVVFRPKTPRISLDSWKSDQTYAYGERVHHRGDAWRCMGNGVTEEPGMGECDRSPWEVVRIPLFMVPCIRTFVKASFQEDEQGRAQTYRQFESELDELRETYCGGTSSFDRTLFGGFAED